MQLKALVFISQSDKTYDVEVTREVNYADSENTDLAFKSVHTLRRNNILFIVCLIEK